MKKVLKKLFYRLFSTGFAGLLMLLFAISIGAATFIENDFGTSAAQKIIFKTTWFEILLALFGISILVNIFRFRLIQQRKWATLSFHVAVLVILIGSAVTRYLSFEGMMHIREDDSSNMFISSDTYLLFNAQQKGKSYRFDEKVLFASLGRNHFKKSYRIGQDVINVELEEFIPNPENKLQSIPGGSPVIKVVIAGENGREEYFLKDGEYKNIKGAWFNFGNPDQPGAVNIYYRNDSLVFNSPETLTQLVMATQKRDTLEGGNDHPLMLRSLYSGSNINFVIGDFNPGAELVMTAGARKMESESIAALKLKIDINDQPSTLYVYGNKGSEGNPVKVSGGNTQLSVSYGAKRIQLPFTIKLRDFIMDRYPGTNSASSYASEVTLTDPGNHVQRDQRIFMNNILNYDGYRFFQSSFDQDELGTVLSVNHDFWGTKISYTGYFLLTLGMVLTLINRRSRFREVSDKLKEMRSADKRGMVAGLIFLLMLVGYGTTHADNVNHQGHHIIPKAHAASFGRLLVQDQKGRMKPMNTLSSEVLRKISRKENLDGLSPDQVFLSMMLYPEEWTERPMIKISNQEAIRNLIRARGELAAFNDFFSSNGQYILKDQVRKAYSLQAIDRTQIDKEIMKIDERVNICNMIFNGSMARLFPVEGDPDQQWLTPADVVGHSDESESIAFGRNFFQQYATAVNEAENTNDWTGANDLIETLHNYQHEKGGDLILSQRKVDMEILLNKMNVFSRLSKAYGMLGFIFLVLFFVQVFKPQLNLKWPSRITFILLIVCFGAHVLGLGIRWYVSGRAPWSNGYESMIYIGFTTMLAGLIFARKSLGGLAATSILASTILMVAGLSWLDPEITPLVPVLKSYWLTIHVSMEAGSYGFLMLGAIIGLLNLALMVFLKPSNKERIFRTIKELTYVSEMTLIGGLLMVSTGTYLGGVWANESWGRYWGWDAKETWALVTTLVYAFILHMRFIPGLRGLYAFNLASLFGFASVMMTYFGVNYYLSGLHSYAAGDPVPIPPVVYYTALTFAGISLIGYWKFRQTKNTKKLYTV
jgi:cytochrome c-type biogenesis protein CcsB